MNLFFCLFLYLFIYLFVYLFIYLFICLFVYSFFFWRTGGANNQSTGDLSTTDPSHIIKTFFRAANRLEYDGRSTSTVKSKNIITGSNQVKLIFIYFILCFLFSFIFLFYFCICIFISCVHISVNIHTYILCEITSCHSIL